MNFNLGTTNNKEKDLNFSNSQNFNQFAPPSNNVPSSTNFSFQKKGLEIKQNNSNLEELSLITRRMKLLENTVNSLRNSSLNMEKNFVENNKDVKIILKTLEEENQELKETVRTLKTILKKIANDMENVARDDEVKVIKKYLDLWNPVKFTTPEQVKRIIRDEISTNSIKKENTFKKLEDNIFEKQNLKKEINIS